MSVKNLMRHAVSIYSPVTAQDATAATIMTGNFTTIEDAARGFVQPASSKDIQFYQQRGLETSHTVYLDKDYSLDRNDRIVYNGRELWVVGVRNLCEFDRVWAIDCNEYPSPAKKR